MKRFVAVLSSLLVLPAFAEVMPISYDEVVEYTDVDVADNETNEQVQEAEDIVIPMGAPSLQNLRGRTSATASRAVPAIANNAAARRNVATGRVTASSRDGATTARTVTSRNVTTRANAARNTTTRGTSASRAANTVAARTATIAHGANVATPSATAQITTTRRAMTNNGTTAARASIIQTDTVNTPLYTGRVSTRSSAIRARIPTISASSGTTTSSTTSAEDTSASMDELAQLTDFCKAQYTQCMDNFCNVLDDTQGRCSCSKNIKNYAETEAALKEATEALQDVAQEIQYIGLTSQEVETLFAETEAELTMSKTSDSTTLKNDLDRIKKLIVEVKPGSASSTAVDTGLAFDLSGLLDFNISSTGFDLSSLFGNNTANTSSISNQRGEQLYKTATARCKSAVLNECSAQGVDISVITNSYDLEIDKSCIAYERELTDTNDEMSQTIRNAKSVLQRARLMVAQQKNAYGLRECVNQLDSCMQDDFVCGSDYENCLDPSGKYIVNGEIVVGSTPSTYNLIDSGSVDGLYSTWNYDKGNAWASGNTLADYIDATVKSSTSPATTSNDMSLFLQNKIGYNADGKNYGMCVSILNKCQDYSYDDSGKYDTGNQVIKEYLQRTLIQIKNKQDEIIANHAEECITDISSCLATNNYDPDKDSTLTKNKIAINACYAKINTCMSVNGIEPDNSFNFTQVEVQNWINSVMGNDNDTSTGGGSNNNQNGNGNIVAGGGKPTITNLKAALQEECNTPIEVTVTLNWQRLSCSNLKIDTASYMTTCIKSGGISIAPNCGFAVDKDTCASINATYNSTNGTCECTNGKEWLESANKCIQKETLTQAQLLTLMSSYCSEGIEQDGDSCVACKNNTFKDSSGWSNSCRELTDSPSTMPRCCIQ